MILPCTCISAAQDKFHGPGNRVTNPTGKGPITGMTRYRCAVCGKEHYRRSK